jgi:hypothetical protein
MGNLYDAYSSAQKENDASGSMFLRGMTTPLGRGHELDNDSQGTDSTIDSQLKLPKKCSAVVCVKPIV